MAHERHLFEVVKEDPQCLEALLIGETDFNIAFTDRV